METATATLVTIVVPFSSAERLKKDLRQLGVSGYTTVVVNGFGTTGVREYSLMDAANVRVETLVVGALCSEIFHHLRMYYEDVAFVAHAHTVEAIPREHFEHRPGRD